MMKQKKLTDDLDCYKVEDIARIVKVSKSTAYQWCIEDAIPNIKIKGTIRIPKNSFEEFWKKKTRIPKGMDLND